MKRKVFFVFLVAAVIGFGFAPHVFADAGFLNREENAEAARAWDDQRGMSNTTSDRMEMANKAFGLLCWLGDVHSCTTDTNKYAALYQGSALGTLDQGVTAVYAYKPASFGNYIAYVGQKAGVVRPAYAQGIGFSGLEPLIGLWQIFRNIAYALLIIILVTIGFMIMFRMKLDPRTVISIQSALPRIVVTLVLITFSYAIVGILIDLMYLTITVTVLMVKSSGILPGMDVAQTLTQYTGGNIGHLLNAVFTTGTGAIDDITQTFPLTIRGPIDAIVGAVIGRQITGDIPIIGTLVGGVLGGGASAAGVSPIIALVVYLSLFFTFIRILFLLISAYVQVIISLIFGPLYLVFGAVPNINAFGFWIRGLIANLATFPVVMLLLLFGLILSSSATANQQLWTPPGIVSTGAGVAGFIAFGMVMTIPEIVGAMKKLFQAQAAIPGGAGAVFGPVRSVAGTAMGGLSQLYYFKQIQQAGGIGALFGIGKKPGGSS